MSPDWCEGIYIHVITSTHGQFKSLFRFHLNLSHYVGIYFQDERCTCFYMNPVYEINKNNSRQILRIV